MSVQHLAEALMQRQQHVPARDLSANLALKCQHTMAAAHRSALVVVGGVDEDRAHVAHGHDALGGGELLVQGLILLLEGLGLLHLGHAAINVPSFCHMFGSDCGLQLFALHAATGRSGHTLQCAWLFWGIGQTQSRSSIGSAAVTCQIKSQQVECVSALSGLPRTLSSGRCLSLHTTTKP